MKRTFSIFFKINFYLANINAILLLVGYSLYTSLIFGIADFVDPAEIRSYSIIYRAVVLLISVLLILLNFKKKYLKNNGIKVFSLFWLLFSCRIIYDLFIRSPEISPSNTAYFFQFIFGGVLIPVFALFKSQKYLNLKLIYNSVFIALFFVVLKGAIINTIFAVINSGGRAQMNSAQSTLTFGSFGDVLTLISYSKIISKDSKFRVKILIYLSFLLGLYAVAIAASRGPLFSLVISLLVGVYANNFISLMKYIVIFLLTGILFGNSLLNMIEFYFPVIYRRTEATLVEKSLGGRESVFDEAIIQSLENPFFGDWFILDRSDPSSIAHNTFLQSSMSLGFFGLILNVLLYFILFRAAINIIKINSIYSFWGYLSVFYMSYSLTTGGSIYIKPEYNFAFLILLIISVRNSKLYNDVYH